MCPKPSQDNALRYLCATVRPWEARFLENGKTRAAQNRAS